MTITVVGLGKIGLPLACQFAASGHSVIGADIDERVVDLVNQGIEPFPGEAELDRRLAEVVSDGSLRATTSTSEAVAESDTVVVVVPVIVDADANPDLRGIDSATAAIAAGLRPGTLVSYETTLPVHTTKRFVAALEQASGLSCGSDFFVCHSPERVLTGRVFSDLRKYPKLVGGVDAASAARAVEFYTQVLQFDDRPDLDRPNGVWDLGSAEAAELAKLAETTYRNVNIAFANELALHADRIGVDVEAVIAASNSQPYSHIHRPGIAVGGHCIPVYPKFYLSVDTEATLPAAAIRLNESMPERVVKRLEDRIGTLRGRTVAVLGISYRGGVKETAFSGAFPLRDALHSRGATVVAHDPMYDDDELRSQGFEPFTLGSRCDAVVVQADHRHYGELSLSDVPGALAVFDGRRVVDASRFCDVPVMTLGDGGGT
jgi:nucleotide sugar dehydrogenase